MLLNQGRINTPFHNSSFSTNFLHRLNLKFGGTDVTNAFIKALLVSQFPYRDINLWRRYDYLLAEELKLKYYTLNDAVISVQVCDFHLRAPGSDTKKYSFKCYDEVMIAPMVRQIQSHRI